MDLNIDSRSCSRFLASLLPLRERTKLLKAYVGTVVPGFLQAPGYEQGAGEPGAGAGVGDADRGGLAGEPERLIDPVAVAPGRAVLPGGGQVAMCAPADHHTESSTT
jgi:hypothetical protein